MIRPILLSLALIMLLAPAWSDPGDWDFHHYNHNYTYSQYIDDYYSLGYIPYEHRVGAVDLSVLSLAPMPLPPSPPSNTGQYTVSFPDGHGGITAVVIKKSGEGFVGPKGEYYPEFPKPWQLQMKYGSS